MAKNQGNKIGSWAFLIGIILAIVLGIVGVMNSTWMTVFLVIGLIIGLFNIADEEVQPFLMSGTVLIIASYFGTQVVSVIGILSNILQGILLIFVPATIIVAIKNVFSLAKH